MKAWSVIGLLFAAAIFGTVPISPEVTSRGVELSVDQAQAITYGRYRRVHRRGLRRSSRYARPALRRISLGGGGLFYWFFGLILSGRLRFSRLWSSRLLWPCR